jgi:hypothetical protein
MTHDELLDIIGSLTCCSGAHNLALRAVVELHKPIISTAYPESLGICLTCTPSSLNFYEATRYPCPTIQAIEKELK